MFIFFISRRSLFLKCFQNGAHKSKEKLFSLPEIAYINNSVEDFNLI